MKDRPTFWKLALFLIAVVSLLYGAALIVDIRVNEPKYTKLEDFEKLVDEEFSSYIQNVEGTIKSKNGFFVNEIVQAELDITTIDKIKQIDGTLIEDELQSHFQLKNDEGSKTELIKISDSKWKLNKKNIVFPKEGQYKIIFSGMTNDNQTFRVVTNDPITIYGQLDQLEFESNKQTIKNGIIMEGISWIILGATGITFLAQIGIKE